MKKTLITISAALLAAAGAHAQLTADWKMHMPFDAWPVQVIDTPGRVYFINRTFEKNLELTERSAASHSLFYYDKKGDEIISVNERANANGNAVACIAYNAEKKYLLVAYTDCNIDFIYDDGRLFNLPALKITGIPGRKEINSVTFDSERNRAYLATSFGYIALNDDKHEVAESRTYGENIQSIGRCGSNIVLASDGVLYYAPAETQRFSFEDYTPVEDALEADVVLPLDGEAFVAYMSSGSTAYTLYRGASGGYTRQELARENNTFGVQEIPGGYRITGNGALVELTRGGDYSSFSRPESEWRMPAASYDGKTVWTLTSRKGLRSYDRNNGMALTRDYMRPNAPATYISSSFGYSPAYGLLCGSNGYDLAYSDFSQSTPSNISALKGGFWKEFGQNYWDTGFGTVNNYGGLAIDPVNPDHVYRNSTIGGLMRVNLANPEDVLVMANPRNGLSGKPNFITVADNQAAWSLLCRFTTPQFTSDGTLWTLYNNFDEDRAELWYWPSADRFATTSPATYRPMKRLPVPAFASSNNDCMIALSRNKNMFVIGGMTNSGTLIIFDHNGTPDNTRDDRYVYITNPYDQDGGGVNFLAINNLYEDPSTGLVWIMSQRGLFTINPATAFDEPDRVNRIKVARNDGTNLADYLLNEINVNGMTIDGEGRKWFSTSNGLVCTSADGRTILAEFTSDNSYLPDNNVYATGYNPESNSLMVATGKGLVEMFPSGSGGGSAAEGSTVRAYPNPVEPDFYGWVRIDNIADGSLVKITDAKGGIVKELGPAQGGSVEWDVSGLNNTRVSTGVYYIMVSPGNSGEGTTQVSKILVLN